MRKQELTWYTLEEKQPPENRYLVATFKQCLTEYDTGFVDGDEFWTGSAIGSDPREIDLVDYVDEVRNIKEWAILE